MNIDYKTLVNEILKDREENCVIDSACVKRLMKYAKSCGKDGRKAEVLLEMVCDLLNIDTI